MAAYTIYHVGDVQAATTARAKTLHCAAVLSASWVLTEGEMSGGGGGCLYPGAY